MPERVPGPYLVLVDGATLKIKAGIVRELSADETKDLVDQLKLAISILELFERPTRVGYQRDDDGRVRKIPLSEYPEIFRRLEAGESFSSVARSHRVTASAIYAIVRKHRPDLAPPALPGRTTSKPRQIQRQKPNKRKHRYPNKLIPTNEYPTIIARVAAGEMQVAVAKDYGVSRERIRQIVKRHGNGAIEDGKALRAALAKEQARVLAEVRMVQTAIRLGPCRICGGPILRRKGPSGKQRTCSPRCARLWMICRLHLDPASWKAHKILVAKWKLDHLDPNDPKNAVQLRHSRRQLEGTATRRGTWAQKGSATERALKEIKRLRAQVAASGESWWT